MKRYFLSSTVFFAVVFAAVALTSAAIAETVGKKRTFGLRGTGEGHIQMRSMLAPVHSKRSKRAVNATVTVILTVKDKSLVGKVCKQSPRVNDALMQTWYKKPIEVSYLYDRGAHKKKGTDVKYRRTKAQKAEDKRLIKRINQALGGHDVTRIVVLKGAVRADKGAISKLPFSSVNGCDELEAIANEGEEAKKKLH